MDDKQADAQERLKAWEKAAAKSAPGGNVEALNWVTPEGIAVRPLYTAADDLPDCPHRYPARLRAFRARPAGHHVRLRPWTIRQYAGFSTAEESNAFYRKRSPAAGRASAWPSIWPPIVATTAIIRAFRVTSARPAWPSTPSRT